MTRPERFASIAASLLLITAWVAEAQVAKKYITPDGKTIYSDVPVPGAREVGEIVPPPKLDPEGGNKGEQASRTDAERTREAEKRLQDGSAQQDRIQAAEEQLENARNALASGQEPLPGERIGVAGAGSRLTDAYYERQKANERAVEQAQKQLDTVRAGR